jgi:hypothetical protein
LPRFSHPSERLALKPRGPALPVAPPDEVASCPASCIFGFCRRPSFELPRLASFGASQVEAQVALVFFELRLLMRPPGRPGFCIFRPCRRWIIELPRISHPSAHLALKPEVSPEALLFLVCLLMHFPGCPGSCIFRLCRRRIFELPRISRPSVPLALLLRVSLRHRSSSGASRCGCRLPRPFHLPASPWVFVFELPRILTPLGAG